MKFLGKFSQQDLRDFFEHAPVGLHAFGPDRGIIDMNQTELDMLGYCREEVVGKKSWVDLIVPEEATIFERHWRDINAKGEVRNLKYTMVAKDGRQYHVLLNASARFDAAGKLINTWGSVVDISERYQREQALSSSGNKPGKQKAAQGKNNVILLNWMDKWDEEKRNIQRNIQQNMEHSIFPLLEKMKRRGSSLDQRNLVLLEKYLKDLTGDFAAKLMDKRWRLSTREMEVCKMLKNGLKTKEIADLLCTSLRTIEHHRNHIRKKLGISKSDIDLGVYLQSFSFRE